MPSCGSRSGPPVIGLTGYRQPARSGVWDTQACFLPAVYLDGVSRAGGVAVVLPPQPVGEEIAEAVVGHLDALILTGGRDVDPGAYRRRPHPATEEPDTARDRWEFALLAAALRRRMPVLGICRGAQVLNVALGGTLYQHLPDIVGHGRHQRGEAVFSTSAIAVTEGSRLAGLIGNSTEAQCYHHQAIETLGAGLAVCAAGADGVIEAVEMPGEPFVLAVQWHPEETPDDLRLFAGLVDAARTFATEKVSP